MWGCCVGDFGECDSDDGAGSGRGVKKCDRGVTRENEYVTYCG